MEPTATEPTSANPESDTPRFPVDLKRRAATLAAPALVAPPSLRLSI
jgi:hypothetical protein